MITKLKHAGGNWTASKCREGMGCCGMKYREINTDRPPDQPAVAQWIGDILYHPDEPDTAELITLAQTAPHHCSDPECPGDVNRQKLEAFDALEASHKRLLEALSVLTVKLEQHQIRHHCPIPSTGDVRIARNAITIAPATITQAPEGPCSSGSLSAGRP